MRYAFLLIPLAALLAAACGGGASPTPTPTPSPSPAVVLPSPTAEPTPTTVPESPTLPPESGGMDGFRAFAVAIDEALARGDSLWFMERAIQSRVECTGPNYLGAGPCSNWPTVTLETGVWWYLWGSDAKALVSPERIAEITDLFLSTAEPTESDSSGTGETALYALASSPERILLFPGLEEEAFFAVFTGIFGVREGPEELERLETPERRTAAYLFAFVDGTWRLGGVIEAVRLAEDWLSGECAACYDHWERWEDDWQTYRNDEYGFEFQHPESCEVEETDGSFSIAGSRGHLVVSDSEGLSLAEYVDRFIDEGLNEPYEIESTQRGSVGGRESITISYRFGGLSRFGTATFVERDASIYRFGFEAGGYTCAFGPEVYTRMLSTFRFLE